MRNKYRVVRSIRRDLFDWEIKYWWLPFLWLDGSKNWPSAERAEEDAKYQAAKSREGRVVKFLGRLP